MINPRSDRLDSSRNKTILFTVLAMLAFAGNSILCRLALDSGSIDAGSFTIIRLLSGAIALLLIIVGVKRASHPPSNQQASLSVLAAGSWLGAAALFFYAILFSFGYIVLDTATGALVLFGVVQITMVAYNILKGNKMRPLETVGFVTACAGFVFLVWPELSTPSLMGLVLMSLAGISWAIYTVVGLGSQEPLIDTGANFLRAAPIAVITLLIMVVFFADSVHFDLKGVALAISSGVITSGVGYALWYAALKNLSNTVAAVSQLSVPVLAAIFGLIFANEAVEWRLVVSSVLVLGGILLVIMSKRGTSFKGATKRY